MVGEWDGHFCRYTDIQTVAGESRGKRRLGEQRIVVGAQGIGMGWRGGWEWDGGRN